MSIRIVTVDAFTSVAFAGNPAAVCVLPEPQPERWMRNVAREMNLSETVFIQRPTNNRALARLRIFTTTQELPLAGHPVIGTWFLLAELGVVPASEGRVHILQQTGAGILPVEFTFHNGRPVRVTMTQKPARFSRAPFSRAALAATLGLKPSDLVPSLPLEFVSTGIANLMVPVTRRAVLAKIQMNMRALAQLIAPHGTMAYCFAIESRGRVRSRGMLPWGIMEDPATGSAAGSLGAYLVHHGQLKPSEPLLVAQGVEMGRPSEIHVEVVAEKDKLTPKVSGSAVRIFEGEIDA